MIDPNAHELIALEDAGQNGGEYLDSIDKTDLATLTDIEWHTFLRTVIGGFSDSLQKQANAILKLDK